jgi:hypothetical protein
MTENWRSWWRRQRAKGGLDPVDFLMYIGFGVFWFCVYMAWTTGQ